jgi:hypothetical protein
MMQKKFLMELDDDRRSEVSMIFPRMLLGWMEWRTHGKKLLSSVV